MRRFLILAILIVVSLAAVSQAQMFQNIPPSVTSITNSSMNPGIPASVTSIRSNSRPILITVPPPPLMRHHRDFVPVFIPVYSYPYGYGYNQYPFYPYSDASSVPDYPPQQARAATAEPEVPAPTVFENRPGYKPPAVAPAQSVAPASEQIAVATKEPEPAEPQPPTLLVFRDGHKLEIGNYVIVGETLYNMSGASRTYKIPIADLDLPATIKVNEDRGIEFRIPAKKSAA